MGINRAPLIVTFEEVRFHWKDSKMGDKIGNIWHTVQVEKFYERLGAGKLCGWIYSFFRSFCWNMSSHVKQWQVYVDSEYNARGSRVGIITVSPKGLRLEVTQIGLSCFKQWSRIWSLHCRITGGTKVWCWRGRSVLGFKISSESNRRELWGKGLSHVTIFKVVWIFMGKLPKS